MKNTSLLRGFALLSVLSLVGFVACSKKESGSAGAKSAAKSEGGIPEHKILRWGNGTEPAGLDVHVVTGVPEHNVIAALFEGLVSENPKTLEPEPAVADSWTVENENKKFTFKIRKNAVWSNGEAITAQDVVYSWKRVLSPKLASEYAYMLYVLENGEAFNKGKITDFSKVGVKAVDDHTLVVNTAGPTPYFLSLLAHYSTFIVHPKTIEKFGAIDERGTKWTRPENIVSNGPFKLKEWTLNKIIKVSKSDTYWDKNKVQLEEVHYFPIDDQNAEERMFRKGKLDRTSTLPSNKIAVYREKNPEFLHIDPYLGTYYYRVNVRKPQLKDARVRKALSMAIDRQAIVEKVTKGGQIPALSFTPPNTGGYTARAAHEENVERARQLLAEAGYPKGKGFPTTELLYNTSEGHKQIAVALQQMWKENLGVNITLNNQDWKVYLNSNKTGNYDVARAGWIGDYNDPNTFLDMWVKDGGNNQTGWFDTQYDELIKKASLEANPAKRLEFFQQAETILLEHAPVIPVYTYTRVYLLNPAVQGYYPNIIDHHPLKYISKIESGAAGR